MLQMPHPMAIAPPITQPVRPHPRPAAAMRALRSSAAYDASTATAIDTATSHGS